MTEWKKEELYLKRNKVDTQSAGNESKQANGSELTEIEQWQLMKILWNKKEITEVRLN